MLSRIAHSSLPALAFVLLALVALVLLSGAIALTWHVVGLALYLFMAGLIGALADAIVPGTLPWGWLGAVLAGLLGSWLGTLILSPFGTFGLSLFGVPVIPAFVGALILAFAFSVLARRRWPEDQTPLR
jgi:uncharacterized membrane protein YeaQ/YmgE (transglycosylase-associated protein family)